MGKKLKSFAIVLIPAIILGLIGFFSVVYFVSRIDEPTNPQDVAPILLIYTIPAASIGFLVGVIGGTIFLVMKSRKKRFLKKL